MDRNFILTLASAVAGLAIFTTLGAMLILRQNRRHNLEIMSVTEDRYPRQEREPEPLPLTRQASQQISNQLTRPMTSSYVRSNHESVSTNASEEYGYGGEISVFDPSTIQSEQTSVWGRRLERDASYDIESKPSSISDFVLPSVFDPSTIRTHGSMARRTAMSKAFEGLEFFNDEPIPDQIFCIDEEDDQDF